MNTCDQPLVTIVTPVYNGEAYLRECIESVRTQTYSHWEYLILNNCSTDNTRPIAEEYAVLDKRIRVYNTEKLLDVISNHNRAFSLMSQDSKYCKVVSADDVIFPDCIASMVNLAESAPSVGLVVSYQLSGGPTGWYVRCHGLPYYRTVISGREICRLQLLGELSVFGAPTSNMYRADLVRSTNAFYPNSSAEADISACFRSLRDNDFGFVHQVLSFERRHEMTITTVSRDLDAYWPSKLGDVVEYGPWYLSPGEVESRRRGLLDEYYAALAVGAVNLRKKYFWEYHRKRLGELGQPLRKGKLAGAVCAKVADMVLNPKDTAEKLLSRVRS